MEFFGRHRLYAEIDATTFAVVCPYGNALQTADINSLAQFLPDL